MNALFAEFTDVDGSFVRKFPTGGFSTRVFELALFAYLQEHDLDLDLDRRHPAPIFTSPSVARHHRGHHDKPSADVRPARRQGP